MTPKNGLSGRSLPHGSFATIALRSMAMCSSRLSGKSSGSVPTSGRMTLRPQSVRSRMSLMRTSSTSPGCAPSMRIGPVRMWALPSCFSVSWTACRSGGTSNSLPGSAPGALATRQSTSTVSPDATVMTGGMAGSKCPQCTVSGVLGR